MVVILLSKRILRHFWGCKTHVILLLDALANLRSLGKPSVSLPVLTWLVPLTRRLRRMASLLEVWALGLKLPELLRRFIIFMSMVIDGTPLVVLLSDRMVVLSRRNHWLMDIFGGITDLVKMWPICLASQVDISVVEALGRRSLSRPCRAVRAKWAASLLILGNFTNAYVLNKAAVTACVIAYDLLMLSLLEWQIWRCHLISSIH